MLTTSESAARKRCVHAADVALTVAALLAMTAPFFASAQSYPVKPVRIISPYAPGGGNDTLARAIAPKPVLTGGVGSGP